MAQESKVQPKSDNANSNQSLTYQIRVEGHLDRQRANWFEGFELREEATGTTLITGSVPDQAALYSVLTKVRDLNIPLLSVTQIRRTHQEDTSKARWL